MEKELKIIGASFMDSELSLRLPYGQLTELTTDSKIDPAFIIDQIMQLVNRRLSRFERKPRAVIPQRLYEVNFEELSSSVVPEILSEPPTAELSLAEFLNLKAPRERKEHSATDSTPAAIAKKVAVTYGKASSDEPPLIYVSQRINPTSTVDLKELINLLREGYHRFFLEGTYLDFRSEDELIEYFVDNVEARESLASLEIVRAVINVSDEAELAKRFNELVRELSGAGSADLNIRVFDRKDQPKPKKRFRPTSFLGELKSVESISKASSFLISEGFEEKGIETRLLQALNIDTLNSSLILSTLTARQRFKLALAKLLLSEEPFLIISNSKLFLDPDEQAEFLKIIPEFLSSERIALILHPADVPSSFDPDRLSARPSRRRLNDACVYDLLDIDSEVGELFALLPAARRKGLRKESFMMNSDTERCPVCRGERFVGTAEGPFGEIFRRCKSCGGTGLGADAIAVDFKGRTFRELWESTLGELTALFENQPSIYPKLARSTDPNLQSVRVGTPFKALSFTIRSLLASD